MSFARTWAPVRWRRRQKILEKRSASGTRPGLGDQNVCVATTTVVIRKYGLLEPIDWGLDCHEQLLLQNKLWNRLVRIERETQARYREILLVDPDYGRLVAEIEDLEAKLTQLWRSRSSNALETPGGAASEGTGVQIRTLIARRRRLRQRDHAMRSELRPKFAAPLLQADNERKAAAKHARQESGLWWGNYNAICSAYERARVRALHTGALLHFRAFDGTGRFRNQIVGGMSVDDLFAGRHAQVRAASLPDDAHTHPVRAERRRRSRTTLTATVYTLARERRNLTWPMIMHRPIPPDARIKEIVVTRKREGTAFRWSAIFICTRTNGAIQAPATSRAAGMTLACRTDPMGVRIATVLDTEGCVEHLRLPDAVVKRAAYIETVRARLDTRLRAMCMRLSEWIADESFPHALDALARLAAQSRLVDAMMHLASAWREHPEFRPAWREEVESWRRVEKRERTEVVNLHRKMLGQRRQHYQCEAKRLAERYGAITLSFSHLATTAHRADASWDETPSGASAPRMHRLVALSELVEWLHTQCAKTGTQIEQLSEAATPTCHSCGSHQHLAADSLQHTCTACAASWDLDENAAANTLARLLKHGRV